MADEQIVNTLGFNVSDALVALQRLENALQASGRAFAAFGDALDTFNGRAKTALDTMRGLASAAGRLASASQKMGVPATPGAAASMTAAQGAGQGFWLPPGMEAETKRLNDALRNVGTSGADAAKKIKTGMDDAANATAGAKKKGDELIVSWNTIARVVMTQTIVRAMSQVRDALREAVEASVEFQRRIAEIQTIAPRFGDLNAQIQNTLATSRESLTREVAEFSKAANIPLPQVAEGYYQTLSNQFTEVADRTRVMQAAMALSKVGVMDFSQAVVLLTGTMNAYGMTSAAAESLTAKFVTTINLGQVRGEELAAVMGQAYPVAAELGVSIDELNAAMVVMTIGGIDAHKSVTALRQAMVAFLKPSEDMKRVVRDMGFSDPTQLVAAKTLAGAIKAIEEAAEGAPLKIAESFRNVRAELAAFRLSSEKGAEQYTAALDAMAKSTPEALQKLLSEFRSTDSERLTQQINALKVNLTQGFGAALTKVLADIMEVIGGADKLAAALTALAAAAVPAAAALGGVALALGVVKLVAMGPVALAIGGIVAALAALVGYQTYATQVNIANIRKESEARNKAVLDFMRGKDEELRKWREVEEAKNRAAQSEWAEGAAEIRRHYFRALDELKRKNEEAVRSARGVMESMVAAQERVVAAYRNGANAALRMTQESQNRRAALEGQVDDRLFKERNERLQLNTEHKADATLRRAWELEKLANDTLARAQTADDVQRAQTIQQRAKAYLDEGTALAKETQNTWLQYQAERSILQNLEAQVNAEKQLERLQAERTQRLADQAAKEQGRLNQMKTLMKSILEDLDAFDKKGEDKSPKELKEQETRLRANVKSLRDLYLGGAQVSVADLLSFDQLQRRIEMALEGGVSEVDIEKLNAVPKSLANLREQIETGVGPIRVLIEGALKEDPKLAAEVKGMSAGETVDHLQRQLEQARGKRTEYEGLVKAQKDAQESLTKWAGNARAELKKYVDQFATSDVGVFGSFQLLLAPNSEWSRLTREAVKGFMDRAQKFTKAGAQVSERDFADLQAAYERYIGTLKPSPEAKEVLEQFIKEAQNVTSSAKTVQAGQKMLDAGREAAQEAEKRIPRLEEALEQARQLLKQSEESPERMKTSAQAAGDALSKVAQIDMSGLVGQAQSLADAMWDAASASWSVQAPALTAAHGGKAWNFLATGGRPQGTDVIPAMLSPGEVVINAGSARRFAAQLTAINAGVQPVYRSEGGSVTNIGDINLTVNGGEGLKLDSKTARSFATMIRRELRRGTATL